MVVVVVPESVARSLLSGTTDSPVTETQILAEDAANGTDNKAAPRYVIESLSTKALETLLKRQGDQIIVLHHGNAGRHPDGSGGSAVQDPEEVSANGRYMLDAAVFGLPSTSNGNYRPDDDFLSLREQEVLSLVADGASNAAISGALFISVETVKTHMKNIKRKLKTSDRNQTALVGRIICGSSPTGGSVPE